MCPAVDVAGVGISGIDGEGGAGEKEPPTCSPMSTDHHVDSKLYLPVIEERKYCLRWPSISPWIISMIGPRLLSPCDCGEEILFEVGRSFPSSQLRT